MKSHDNHILMQQLFPIAIRGSLPTEVCRPLIDLSCFFREICSKVLTVEELGALEKRIVVTLCELEMIFPPFFYSDDISSYAFSQRSQSGWPSSLSLDVSHAEVTTIVTSSIQFRLTQQFPIIDLGFSNRYLSRLKSYVHNKTWPESSIAEGYIAEEYLTFC